jgi:hypothetical protein
MRVWEIYKVRKQKSKTKQKNTFSVFWGTFNLANGTSNISIISSECGAIIPRDVSSTVTVKLVNGICILLTPIYTNSTATVAAQTFQMEYGGIVTTNAGGGYNTTFTLPPLTSVRVCVCACVCVCVCVCDTKHSLNLDKRNIQHQFLCHIQQFNIQYNTDWIGNRRFC